MVQETGWLGAAATPRNTSNLKELKSCSNNGVSVEFRRDQTTIWLKQGPGAHQRTNHYGVILSVIPTTGDVSEPGQRINRGKSIYLMKLIEEHSFLDSFDPYRYPDTTPNCVATSLAQASSAVTSITTRGATALSYGGSVHLVQSAWWALRHVAWLRSPVMIPIVIFSVALVGATPTGIAEALTQIGQKGINIARAFVRDAPLS